MLLYLKKEKIKIFLIIISLFIFLIPFSHYLKFGPFNFGGDSTRLYIHYPGYWLKNYSLNLINYGNPNVNSAGNAAMVPQLLIYNFLNLISPNLSIYIHNSFISLSAFLGIFFLLKDTIIKYFPNKNFFLIICLSILFLTSQLYSHIIFNNGGFWVYVFAGVPFICVFFSRFIIYGSLSNLLFFYLFLLLFSTIFLYQNISWSFFFIINCLVLYYPLFLKVKKNKIIKRFLIIFTLFIIFNLGNIISFLNELLNRDSLANQENIFNFRNEANYIGNNFFPLFNLQNLNLQIMGSDVYGSENVYFLKFFLLINSLLIGLSIIYFVNLKSNVKNFIFYKKFLYLLIFFLINFFLINQSFNNLIINFFELLYKIKYFEVFKSYYGKFGFSYLISFLSLIYAFSFFLYKNNYLRACIHYLFFFIIILSSINFINGKIYNLKTRYTSSSYPINGLSNDFYALINFLKEENQDNFNGNVILFPISNEYYLNVNSNDNNSTYVGPSPISLFENINVFNGYYGNKIIYDSFLFGKIEEFLKNLNNRYINYIIFNKSNIKDLELYLHSSRNLAEENFKNFIFENKLFSKAYENNSYLVFKNNKNLLNCSSFKIIRPTVFNFKTYCQNNELFLSDIKTFTELVKISVENLVYIHTNYNFLYSDLNIIKPSVIFEKVDLTELKSANSHDLIIFYNYQIYQDFFIILSIIMPLIIIIFLKFIGKK